MNTDHGVSEELRTAAATHGPKYQQPAYVRAAAGIAPCVTRKQNLPKEHTRHEDTERVEFESCPLIPSVNHELQPQLSYP